MALQGGVEDRLESPVHHSDEDGSLCHTCRNFDLQSFEQDPFSYRGYKYSSAKEAADQGCSFCSLLIDSFDEEKQNIVHTNGWFRSYRKDKRWIHLSTKHPLENVSKDYQDESRSESRDAGLRISSLWAFIGPMNATIPFTQESFQINGTRLVCFHIVADANAPAAIYNDVTGRYVGENHLSSDYIKRIKGWLLGCSSHPKCCITMSGSRTLDASNASLPTRCIQVLRNGCRIAETGMLTGSYITLSHRWTPVTERSRTTTSNIEARRVGGALWLKELPKLFTDTIDLARKLKISYIWIDSLCIVQQGDDGADWQRESVRMGEYYQKALVTIAATSGSNNIGLIPPRTSLAPKIVRLPYWNSRTGSREGYFYVYLYSTKVYQQYDSSVLQTELFQRGWVFQEFLLSRRILYFTITGAWFECQQDSPCNEQGELVESWASNDNSTAVNIQQLHKRSIMFQTGFIWHLWYRLMESYSVLSFTEPNKDRLTALSGIASEFMEAMRLHAPSQAVGGGMEFVSGLWMYDLHRGLLWEQQQQPQQQQSPANYASRRLSRFPSWSWASITCPVIWQNKEKQGGKLNMEFISLITSHGEVITKQSLAEAAYTEIALTQSKLRIGNHITGLLVNGVAPLVLVGAKYQDERELDIASTVSHSRKTERNAWRTVCSSLRPTEVAGWASLEHPDYQDDSSFRHGVQLFALHVSTSTNVGVAYGLGFITPWHSVFNVLFLRNTHDQKYERVGTGKLFGKEIETQFHRGNQRLMELV